MQEEVIVPTPGSVFYIAFSKHVPPAHEQEGKRPAIIVSIPSDHGEPRFPVFIVLPLTTFKNQDWVGKSPNLYPVIIAAPNGIERDSIVLLDQIKAVDVSRVERYIGKLNQQDFDIVVGKLKALLKRSKPRELAPAKA